MKRFLQTVVSGASPSVENPRHRMHLPDAPIAHEGFSQPLLQCERPRQIDYVRLAKPMNSSRFHFFAR
jgi:hypothetical protein